MTINFNASAAYNNALKYVHVYVALYRQH